MKVLVASQMRPRTPIDRHHKTITPPVNRPYLLHSAVKYRSEIFHYSPFLPFPYLAFIFVIIVFCLGIFVPFTFTFTLTFTFTKQGQYMSKRKKRVRVFPPKFRFPQKINIIHPSHFMASKTASSEKLHPIYETQKQRKLINYLTSRIVSHFYSRFSFLFIPPSISYFVSTSLTFYYNIVRIYYYY